MPHRERDSFLASPHPGATQLVPIARIDCEDSRFQLRVTDSQSDLTDSLRQHGQQNPVILMAALGRFRIIDGFGRIRGLKELGCDFVLAIVRDDLDQTQAFALSFVTNARRRNLTPADRAYTVWQATQVWAMGKDMVAKVLGLSIRQIERYLKVFDFSDGVRSALRDGKIAMAHAVLLHSADKEDVGRLINEIVSKKMSAPHLKKLLGRRDTLRHARRFLLLDAAGFRLRTIRYRRNMSEVERQFIRKELERALELVSTNEAAAHLDS